jgi:hypothetical protein
MRVEVADELVRSKGGLARLAGCPYRGCRGGGAISDGVSARAPSARHRARTRPRRVTSQAASRASRPSRRGTLRWRAPWSDAGGTVRNGQTHGPPPRPAATGGCLHDTGARALDTVGAPGHRRTPDVTKLTDRSRPSFPVRPGMRTSTRRLPTRRRSTSIAPSIALTTSAVLLCSCGGGLISGSDEGPVDADGAMSLRDTGLGPTPTAAVDHGTDPEAAMAGMGEASRTPEAPRTAEAARTAELARTVEPALRARSAEDGRGSEDGGIGEDGGTCAPGERKTGEGEG